MSINVRNADESVAFYTDVLGLTVRSDRPDFDFGGAWLDLGDQQVHLLEIDVPDDVGQHFAMHVADLAAAVAELRSKGVDVTDPHPSAPADSRSSTTPPATASNSTSRAGQHGSDPCFRVVRSGREARHALVELHTGAVQEARHEAVEPCDHEQLDQFGLRPTRREGEPGSVAGTVVGVQVVGGARSCHGPRRSTDDRAAMR